MQISELYRCVSHPLPVARKSNRAIYIYGWLIFLAVIGGALWGMAQL